MNTKDEGKRWPESLVEEESCAPRNKSQKERMDELVNRFLAWPLPYSVCADLIATKQCNGRVGTNLLSATEAGQMIEYLLAQATPATPTLTEDAWLIECVTAGTPLWFSGQFTKEGRKQIASFVSNASAAVRYPTRAAAELAFDALYDLPCSMLGRDCYRITEHQWIATLTDDMPERGAMVPTPEQWQEFYDRVWDSDEANPTLALPTSELQRIGRAMLAAIFAPETTKGKG